MKVLFIHPNFPAQFRHLAQWFGINGHEVLFASQHPRPEWQIPGVTKVVYAPDVAEKKGKGILAPLHMAAAHAEAVFFLCRDLKRKGFVPDIVCGHSGWGGTWLLRDIFPKARITGYFEWFYRPDAPDALFGAHGPPSALRRADIRLRNTVMMNDLLSCDAGFCPTRWQREQFPDGLRDRLAVLHDGIDTDFFQPGGDGPLGIPGLPLAGDEKIVTYATRGMEPYRGFPQFIESLPFVLNEVPDCHVVIAGEDRVCYGAPRRDGRTWKQEMLGRVPLPPERVHFVGRLPYGQYRRLLQCSTVHVYLTRPFVLSWSMLEAMSCGCCLVASDTEPVREVVRDGENAVLADFHLSGDIARRTAAALHYGGMMDGIRKKARETILETYALADLLPRQIALLAGALP